MAYQALYRQWRPARFAEMVGQELIVTALRSQVKSGRLAHAYLFCGSRGTGKTSAAKILARAVNCENPQDGDACGECPSCKRMMGDQSFDMLEYDAASNSRVEDMREILDTVQYPPQFGRYKVYVIDEVHMLSANAFNALLKTLEEPPEYMIFVLATTEPQKVPATILSRCQRYDFGRIPAAQIAARLAEAARGAGAEATEGALMHIARAAEGGMRDALSLLDMCIGYGQTVDEALVRRVLGTSDRRFLFEFAEALINEDAAGVLSLIDRLMTDGREPAVFAREMAAHLRSLLAAKTCPDRFGDLMDLTPEIAASYLGQAETVGSARLISMMDLFLAVDSSLRYASSPRIVLESAALHACLRTGEDDTAALRERIADLEKTLRGLQEKLASGAFVPAANAPAAKPAAPAPKAAEAAPKPSIAGDAKSVWDAAIKLLRVQAPGLTGMLIRGRIVSADDHAFCWESQDANFNTSYITGEKNRQLIADALTAAAGVPCTFSAAGPAQKAGETKKADDLGDFFTTFGAANVQVQDK
ncbi:MAG: DNA polymerase III subunit gamma/tau [Clostridia bacterium]|nr:DNA polymerase III subunit gamma/tau [Clostridia bacterium]